MDHRIASARPLGRALTAGMAAAGLMAAALFVAPHALAQTPPKPADKKQAPAKPAQAAPQQPAQQQQQPPQQPANAEVPPIMYPQPWTKVCGKGPETNNKQVCVTSKEGRLENGMPVVMAQLFEPEGEQKILRVVVPIAMQLPPGTRIIIDQNQPAQAPYRICFPAGCMSDYPATDDMIAKMKKGQMLTVQAVNTTGSPISLPLPLGDFGKAYDGPPTDPKVVEEQYRKLQEGVQKKAEEARKKLEAQQPAAAAPAAPPK
jgi:invasion protein IalB